MIKEKKATYVSNFIHWQPEMIPQATRKLAGLFRDVMKWRCSDKNMTLKRLYIREVFPIGTIIPMLAGKMQVVTGYAVDGMAIVTCEKRFVTESMFKAHNVFGKYVMVPNNTPVDITFYDDLLKVFMVLLYPYAEESAL